MVPGVASISIELPWPAEALSPNGRVHFMKKHSAAKKAKEDAFWATRMEIRDWPDDGPIPMTITVHPRPMTRNLDDDNFIARCKAYRDGIAQALDINDNRFVVQPLQRAEPVPNGLVIFTIGGGE